MDAQVSGGKKKTMPPRFTQFASPPENRKKNSGSFSLSIIGWKVALKLPQPWLWCACCIFISLRCRKSPFARSTTLCVRETGSLSVCFGIYVNGKSNLLAPLSPASADSPINTHFQSPYNIRDAYYELAQKIVPPSVCDFLPEMYVTTYEWTAVLFENDRTHFGFRYKSSMNMFEMCFFAPICAHEWNPIFFIECGYSGNNQPCQWAKNRSPNHFLKSRARTYFRFPRRIEKALFFATLTV